MAIPKKPRTCRVCKTVFQPSRPLQTCCSPDCALQQAKFKRAKAERIQGLADRKVIKLRLEAMKPLSYWRKRAQAVFNRWVRLIKCAGMPCISCGTFDGQMHAGHYQNAHDHPELAFEPDNVWIQCAQCNEKKSGNIVEYRKSLVSIIGAEKVEVLESKRPLLHRRADDYKQLEAHYTAKLKELTRGN